MAELKLTSLPASPTPESADGGHLIWKLGSDGETRWANAVAEHADLPSGDWGEFISRGGRGVQYRWRVAVRHGSPFRERLVILRHNGASCLWDVSANPVVIPGEPLEWIAIACDATSTEESKAVEEALIRSEAQFQQIAETTPTLLYIFDLDETRTRFVNSRIGELLGWTADDVYAFGSQALVRLIHPADMPQVLAYHEGLIQGEVEEGATIEYRMRHRNGAWRWFRSYDRVFSTHEDGTPSQIIGMALEITEERSMLDQLRESESRFRALAETLPALVWTTLPDGGADWLNHRWEDYTGRAVRTLFGDGWLSALHPLDREPTLRRWQESVQCEQEYETAYRIRRHDGEYRWFAARGLPVRDPDNQVVRWFGACTDIDDLRSAQSRLAEAQDRMSMAIEAGELGVWHSDLPARKMSWNRQIKAQFGLSGRDEVDAEQAYARIHPDDIERVIEFTTAAVENRAPLDVTFRTRDDEDRQRWIRAVGAVSYGASGDPESFDGLTVDLTERLEAERELERKVAERTDDLQRANRELEGFTYSVSHDLRGPLRAIIGTSMILKEDFGGQIPADAVGLLDRQAQNARKLGSLIDDLLKLSRIGRQPLICEKIDLSALAAEVAGDLEISDTWPVIIEPGISANGDAKLLRFVVQNLFENAVKFSPAGGEIRLGRAADGTYFVSDQGMGFDMEFADKLFLPFERLHRDDEVPGTGIGLANVQRIVHRHGGRVWAESAPGKGATFRFTLGES